MKIQSKVKLILVFVSLFLIIGSAKVFAASISVGPSKSTVSPGESFTVSITSNGATGKVNISVSNGSVSSSSLWLEPSGSVTVTAGSSGTVKISVSASDMSDTSGNEVSPYGSATVTIQSSSNSSGGSGSSGGSSYSGGSSSSSSSSNKKTTTTKTTTANKEEETKSNNAALSALAIELEGATLTPEFAKDTLEYTIDVPNEITELNITATPEDSKATVEVTGNTELQVGENATKVEVTAEDGTKQVYTIKVVRARESLALKTLVVKYKDENGNLIELPLNPAFISNVYEYTLEDLSYKINELILEGEVNLEGANIDIKGNDNLVAGENIITITVRLPASIEGEEVPEDAIIEDEVITYTIKFNKEETPTFWQKVKNKIKGIFGTVKNWYNNNQKPIIMGSLALCIVSMVGLSIYIVIDAKKYRMLLQKLNKVSNLNNLQPVETENIESNNTNIIEDIANQNDIDIDENNNNYKKGGRHF